MKLLTAISALLGLCVLASCSYTNRIEKDALPSEFKAPGQVLLVAKRTRGMGKNRMNSALDQAFRNNYTGKYEMATMDDIRNNAKYQDKAVYRYVLLDDVTAGEQLQTKTTYSSGRTEVSYAPRGYHLEYHIYDRLRDTTYPSIGVASNVPKKAMTRAAKVLNQQLQVK